MAKYIKSVYIRNFWSKGDIYWEMDKEVSVLIGANGSGKTTILNLIHEALGKEEVEIDYNKFNIIDHIELIFTNNSSIKVDNGLRTFTNSSLGDFHIKKINTFDIPTFTINKSTLDNSIEALREPFTRYQRDLLKKIEYHFSTSTKGFSDEQRRQLFAKKQLFINYINELFADKEFIEDTFDFKVGQQKNNLSPFQLSSGEKQLFIILLTLLLQDTKPAILLMDEPEISLHLDWQRQLIAMAKNLNPNCQLIIATHSPSVFFKGWSDKIVRIEAITKPTITPKQVAITSAELSPSVEKQIFLGSFVSHPNYFNNYLQHLPYAIKYEEAKTILEYLTNNDIQPNIFIYNTLLSKSSSFEDSQKLHQLMKEKGIQPNLSFYHLLLKNAHSLSEGMEVLKLMRKERMSPDIMTFYILLGKARTVAEVKKIEQYRTDYGIVSDERYINKLKIRQ